MRWPSSRLGRRSPDDDGWAEQVSRAEGDDIAARARALAADLQAEAQQLIAVPTDLYGGDEDR